MSPADRAVDPLGTASRSITTASTPASFAASAPQIPAAPAPMISSGTRVSHFPAESKLTALMTHQGGASLLEVARLLVVLRLCADERRRRHVKLFRQLTIARRQLVEAPGPVPVPLPQHENGSL